MGAGPARISGNERARLPEHVPALRAEHERRHRLGHLHDRGGDATTSSRPSASSSARTRAAIEVRREAAERFDRELRAALAESVWHTGCTSWYVDENGNDPSQWPWLWSTYRRRTARIEPGAYELST